MSRLPSSDVDLLGAPHHNTQEDQHVTSEQKGGA
jgi:hypothetical protein